MKREERFKGIIDYFSKHEPFAQTELNYSNPYELLVSVILSAQCTDKRVNIVTPELFRRYPDAKALADTSSDEVFPYIKSISYPNNKAKHLVGMAKMLIGDFKGVIPSDVNELMKLPGVGRKTANVIASVIYNQAALPVDTHIFRVSARIGLTVGAKNPLQTEKQLVKHVPDEFIPIFHHWIILHGRYICIARKPKCESCPITKYCKYYETNYTKKGMDKKAK